mmetsp:Transcript_29778/g.21540  ORF Transcript_29778/g.21540 Transcript_29778/m.21540 type:complete len:89 (-) Transcript_29778:83-349(-)|eukprot:CAMPEP_0116876162 /NCGR_PEP_ID=MMETSP0463-20121206/8175_1 /TAXON_ID=181622 /ORGANISM="Strombidinopsis sp, Strain SopsisLIS2011" /LENGTH=88 /DNA_ID=CAMNT_0004522633 /DNA_START=559 /DNA_END=825 /DNA_ORIENTATION=+
MTGKLALNNHYFESGNIQFNLQKEFSSVKLSAADGLTIMKKIDELETAYQKDLEEMHEVTKEDLFKKMRRFVPVTGTKFDWDKPKLMH